MCVYVLFLRLVLGVIVDPNLVRNIHYVRETVRCVRCHRIVGNLLLDGQLYFDNVRPMTMRPLPFDYSLDHFIFGLISEENRSLCGQSKALKRKLVNDDGYAPSA